MPTPPYRVGREFVHRYYTVMSASPENLYCFYTDSASFMHDDIDSDKRQTITADGKMGIHDEMLAHLHKYNQSRALVTIVETMETIQDGLIVQVIGQISFNEQPMRPFSQTIVLVQKSPFHYFVQNDIFRFRDFESDASDECMPDESIGASEPIRTNHVPEPMEQSDWGTQCADYDGPFGEQVSAKQMVARVNAEIDIGTAENEVKLDTSGDSGLSSDAEKAIGNIQSLNLKNILHENRIGPKDGVILRSTPTPLAFIEETSSTIEQQQQSQWPHQPMESTAAAATAHDENAENKSSLFQDSCILTIGNVVNPNIEFYDANCDDEANESDSKNVDEKTDENDGINGKSRNRKRKDKRKSTHDISNEKSINDSIKATDTIQLQTDSNDDDHVAVDNQNKPTECASENGAEQPSKSEPSQPSTTSEILDQEAPKPIVKISYADLAKSGPNEWIDVLANRRESTADKLPTRRNDAIIETLPKGKNRIELN